MMSTLAALATPPVNPGGDGYWGPMGGDRGDGMMGWGRGDAGAPMLAWMFIGLALLAVVALVIFLVWGRASRHGASGAPTGAARTPREVLDHRLASGEITIKEHRALAAEIDGGRASGTGVAPK